LTPYICRVSTTALDLTRPVHSTALPTFRIPNNITVLIKMQRCWIAPPMNQVGPFSAPGTAVRRSLATAAMANATPEDVLEYPGNRASGIAPLESRLCGSPVPGYRHSSRRMRRLASEALQIRGKSIQWAASALGKHKPNDPVAHVRPATKPGAQGLAFEAGQSANLS